MPEQAQSGAPVEPVPLLEQQFTVTQLGFPLLPPIGAQTARHEHADERDEPEPAAKARCECCICHPVYSYRLTSSSWSRSTGTPYRKKGCRPCQSSWSET